MAYTIPGPGTASGYTAAGGGGGGTSEPVQPPAATSQSVAAGAAFATVTFGAFTDPDGLIASYSASRINATGSTAWSGTGLGAYTASGSADGDAGTLYLDALDGDGDIVATAIHSYERGSPAGAASWVDLLDYDMTDVVTQAAVSTGTVTLAFVSSGDTIDMRVTQYAGNSGTVTPTNGTGLLYSGGTDPGTVTAAYTWTAELAATWDNEYALSAPIAVHFVLTSISYPSSSDDGIFAGISSAQAHNSGNARGWYLRRDSVATQEDRRVRLNGSSSSIIDTITIPTSRVLTAILIGGTMVQVMDTTGTTTPPTPAIGGASTYQVGCASLGLLAANPYYSPNAYAYLSNVETATFVCTRILVQMFQ